VGKIGVLYSMRQGEFLNERHFALPRSAHRVVLTRSILEVFLTYRQQGSEPEAGGLLFAEFDFPLIRIVEASHPHATDQRWRTLFIPNRILQRRLIKKLFKHGRHFVGEWHTHPEANPTPSGLDLNSMVDAFLKSQHELNYFIMIIVGNGAKCPELWVSAHDGLKCHRLHELQGAGRLFDST
jgi:integrative and conjugative element protein (TIGR02256 family)